MTATRRTHWAELDVLRGLAGIIMVYNHAGASWLTEAQRADPVMGGLFLIGSYAPVIFFATTGVGYGIQSELAGERSGHAFGFLRKVWILLVADALMWLDRDTWIGLNFLGFIALSMLVLEPLRRRKVGWLWPAVGVVGVAVVRYLIAPRWVDGLTPGQVPTWPQFIAGLGSPPGFSYPLLPWIAYALAGFSVGVLMQRHQGFVLSRRRDVGLALLALGVVGAAVVGWLAMRGADMNRWGSVSKLFFVSGMVALAIGAGISLLVALSPSAARRLSLRGISSLAVVPMHYSVIALVAAAVAPGVLTAGGFVVLSSVAMVVSLVLARRWDLVAQRLSRHRHAWGVLVAVAALAVCLKLLVTLTVLLYVVSLAGQLALCCLLVVTRPSGETR